MVNVKSVAKPGSPYAIALAGDILFILLAFLIFFFIPATANENGSIIPISLSMIGPYATTAINVPIPHDDPKRHSDYK